MSNKMVKSEHGGKNRGRDEKSAASRKDSSRDEARKAKETADEKDVAEDESDQREYLALQSKMEARRIARDIQNSHDTLAILRAEQEDVSAKTEAALKARVESDREKDGDALVPRAEDKKPRAT